MPEKAKRMSRKERVKLSQSRKPSVIDFRSYIPNNKVVDKLISWKNQGAEIYYLTSRTTPEQIADIQYVLNKYNFPDQQSLIYRKKEEEYRDVAEKLLPDILIEDDCESIGGEVEMTYPHIKPTLKYLIKSIIVPEFGGLGHLPNNLAELLIYDSQN